MLMRWANVIEAVALLLGATASLVFLPDAISAYSRDPVDFWLLAFWLVFCVALVGLCAWNAISASRPDGEHRRPLLVSNWTATALVTPVALAGIADSVLLVIGAIALMGPVTQLLRLRGSSRHGA